MLWFANLHLLFGKFSITEAVRILNNTQPKGCKMTREPSRSSKRPKVVCSILKSYSKVSPIAFGLDLHCNEIFSEFEGAGAEGCWLQEKEVVAMKAKKIVRIMINRRFLRHFLSPCGQLHVLSQHRAQGVFRLQP